jgi:thiol-disulfide isomerase/thioredoxin
MKFATYALALCLTTGTAAVATPADSASASKVVSADAVLAGLKRAEQRVRNFSVSIHWTKYYNLGEPKLEAPVKTQADADYVFEAPKKIACAYTSEHFSIKPDKQVSIYPVRGKLAFDGKVCHVLEGPRNFDARHGEIWSYATWNAGPDPCEFITNYFQDPISSTLEKHGIVLDGRTEWEGRPMIVVETPPIKSKTGPERRKLSYWIDAERNWLVVRRSILVQYRPDQKWQEYQRAESRCHTEVETGVWLPRKMMQETLLVSEKQKPPVLAWRDEGEARDWVIDRKLPAKQFELPFPPGTVVDDHTVSPQRAFIVPKEKSPREPMFDEKADARAAIARALTVAKMEKARVLAIWGGNREARCNKLRDLFVDDENCERILIDEYVTIPVDVENNKDLFEQYVKPGERGGFPLLTVLDAEGRVIANQSGESLETGTRFDARKIEAFLRNWAVPRLDAEQVLREGLAQAKRDSKRVFLHLGAPWCGPCRNLDRFLRENRDLFAIDFVDVKVDTDRMTNAGDVAKRYRKAHDLGIPWVAILDSGGKLLATSDDPSLGNFGFPETPDHMRMFFSMLRKTRLRTTPQQLALIEKKLNEDRKRRETARREQDKPAGPKR